MNVTVAVGKTGPCKECARAQFTTKSNFEVGGIPVCTRHLGRVVMRVAGYDPLRPTAPKAPPAPRLPPVATPEQIDAVRALLVGMPKKIRGHADGPCVGDRCLEIHFIGSLGKRFYFQDDIIAGEGAIINVYGDWNLHACAYDAVYGLRLATMTDHERIDFSAALE